MKKFSYRFKGRGRMDEEFAKKLSREIEKVISKGTANKPTAAFSSDGNTYSFSYGAGTGYSYMACLGEDLAEKTLGEIVQEKFIPIKIIYSPPATICFFKDGEKVVAMCHEDKYNPEFGVMTCIVKKVFKCRKSRGKEWYKNFRKLLKTGHWQYGRKVIEKAKAAIDDIANHNRDNEDGSILSDDTK
jgi:hypothetical protein